MRARKASRQAWIKGRVAPCNSSIYIKLHYVFQIQDVTFELLLNFGYWEIGLLDFGKVGFWESGMLGEWDVGKVTFWESAILESEILGKCDFGKVGFQESGILGKWDFGRVGF